MLLRFHLLALFALLAPTVAFADIYTWTDDRGVTVISNERPADMRKVKNFEVVVKSAERASKPASAPREPSATEQALLDRIDSLEKQVKAQQYQPVPAPDPTPTWSPAYYTAPPPPPPVYDGFFPYTIPSPSFIVFPRTIHRHRFGHGHHHRHTTGHTHTHTGRHGHRHNTAGHSHTHRGRR